MSRLILSPELSEVVPALEELLLLVFWLAHLCAYRDCSLKKEARSILIAKWMAEVGGCFGFASTWLLPKTSTTQPGLKSQMIQALSREGGSLMACPLEMLISLSKLLGGSFEIGGSPGVNGSTCLLLPPDFISFSPSPSI